MHNIRSMQRAAAKRDTRIYVKDCEHKLTEVVGKKGRGRYWKEKNVDEKMSIIKYFQSDGPADLSAERSIVH